MESYIIMDKGEGDYELQPAGWAQCVCMAVVPLGYQPSQWGEKEDVAICFETANRDSAGNPFIISKIFTSSLNKKANLSQFLEGWRGRAFTDQERAGFDVMKLIGVNAYISIVHNQSKTDPDKIYANIQAVGPLPGGYQPMPMTNQPVPQWIIDKANRGRAAKSPALNTPPQQQPQPPAPGYNPPPQQQPNFNNPNMEYDHTGAPANQNAMDNQNESHKPAGGFGFNNDDVPF